jgi:hypothetical protein
MHEELFQLRRFCDDFLVPRSFAKEASGGLQAVERALARQSLAAITDFYSSLPLQVPFAAQQRQKGIGTQLIMIVEVFVSETQPVDSLSKQFIDPVLHEPGVTQIREALREPTNELLPLLELTQEKAPGIRGNMTAIERTPDRPSVECLKCELLRATVCSHRSASPFCGKAFVVKHLCRNGRPFSIKGGRVERWRGS